MAGGQSVADMDMSDLTGLPTDDMVLNEIRDILKTADLMTVTKQRIKQELERRFNVNLDAKWAYIGSGKFSRPFELRHRANHSRSDRGHSLRPTVKFIGNSGIYPSGVRCPESILLGQGLKGRHGLHYETVLWGCY